MVCKLPSPHWVDSTSVGLQSAVENVVDGYISLKMGEVLPVYPADFTFYLIYFSSNLDTLFEYPKLVTTKKDISVPSDTLSLGNYISVRASQLGVSGTISPTNLNLVNTDVYSLPAPTELMRGLTPSSTHIVVDSADGWPRQDGYALVGEEVILYSEVIDGYDGYDGLLIQNRDPFSCNAITSHTVGASVFLFRGFEDVNGVRFKPLAACGMPLPQWVEGTDRGIRKIVDLGIGTSVKLEWYYAKAPPGFSKVYYNVYQSESLFTLYKSAPKGFTSDLSAIVPSLSPGKSYYFGVRAFYQSANLDLANFGEISDGFYEYPAEVEINEPDGYLTSAQTETLFVSSTEGFPLQGFLKIGSEVIAYNSKTSTSFNITTRDLFSIGRVVDYANGTKVTFFKGVEDDNYQFLRTVPTWSGASDVKMPLPDGYNGIPADGYNGLAYNQDEDGYRSVLDDIVTEDHSDFEEENKDFSTFPYCGYRAPNYVKLHQQDQCGTYHGGRQMRVIAGVNDGKPVMVGGGVNIFEAAQQRNEVILGLTSEPFVLLRRKTTGKKCRRLSIHTEHPHSRCGLCYGTTFDGGYDRIVNDRQIRPGEANANGFVPIRISPYDNDLELTQDRGLAQTDMLDGWTIAVPIIKDRDILIRYIFDESAGLYVEEFRYEVLKVQRNKLLFGKDGGQKMSLKKLDHQKEVYKFPITLV